MMCDNLVEQIIKKIVENALRDEKDFQFKEDISLNGSLVYEKDGYTMYVSSIGTGLSMMFTIYCGTELLYRKSFDVTDNDIPVHYRNFYGKLEKYQREHFDRKESEKLSKLENFHNLIVGEKTK